MSPITCRLLFLEVGFGVVYIMELLLVPEMTPNLAEPPSLILGSVESINGKPEVVPSMGNRDNLSFVAFIMVVVGGVGLRKLVMRAPDYYEAGDDDE